MIAGALILRSLIGRLRVRTAHSGAGGTMPMYEHDLTPAGEPLRARRPSIHLPSPEDEIPEETLIRMEKKKRVMQYIADKPDEGSRLLKVWLTEE
jgi:flagellar biosynthesis/type III secretory pathway M-ring protein FliF/YscJ